MSSPMPTFRPQDRSLPSTPRGAPQRTPLSTTTTVHPTHHLPLTPRQHHKAADEVLVVPWGRPDEAGTLPNGRQQPCLRPHTQGLLFNGFTQAPRPRAPSREPRRLARGAPRPLRQPVCRPSSRCRIFCGSPHEGAHLPSAPWLRNATVCEGDPACSSVLPQRSFDRARALAAMAPRLHQHPHPREPVWHRRHRAHHAQTRALLRDAAARPTTQDLVARGPASSPIPPQIVASRWPVLARRHARPTRRRRMLRDGWRRQRRSVARRQCVVCQLSWRSVVSVGVVVRDAWCRLPLAGY